MGIKSLIKQVLTEKENRAYQKLLCQKQVSYPEWRRKIEGRDALEADDRRSADFVLICVGEGRLAFGAVTCIGTFLESNPDICMVYGDEDVRGEEAPWFKPDWSPDLLDNSLYFGSLIVMRREFFEQQLRTDETVPASECMSAAGLIPATGEDYKESCTLYRVIDIEGFEQWLHDCVKEAGAYEKNARTIGHIPQILFHGKNAECREKFLQPSTYLVQRKSGAETAFLQEKSVKREPVISVIIPSKDNPSLLKNCVEALLGTLQAPDGEGIFCEVIVVDNGSEIKAREQIERMLTEYGGLAEKCAQFSYIYEPMEFNFSRMCNIGAANAKGEFLLFLNDDVELYEKGCLLRMAALAEKSHVGAVGIKLYYPDSVRIQHAGITNLPMGPVHKLQFMEDNQNYYYNANRGRRNVLAVTAACMMVAKTKFNSVGGFKEALKVAFNDVELCFALYEAGYHNVCANDIFAYHHESLSRGADESAEKLDRLLAERARLYEMHPKLKGYDPYYSVHLNREGLDTRICPAFETERNIPQEISQRDVKVLTDREAEAYRRDECLMVRVEDFRDRRAIGYSVVLGDNNACYDRMFLLERDSRSEKQIYVAKLSGQYRPDLQENMPDQTNVALNGYDVSMQDGAIPSGRYRVGAAAVNRVTGLKLINWTNRYVEL